MIFTDPEKCTRIRHEVAIPMFNKRDERLATMTDEAVDVYYSCIMCQAFSPSHVCIVTPERLGLCGAVSWFDAKATNELDPTGPCQVVPRKASIDEEHRPTRMSTRLSTNSPRVLLSMLPCTPSCRIR